MPVSLLSLHLIQRHSGSPQSGGLARDIVAVRVSDEMPFVVAASPKLSRSYVSQGRRFRASDNLSWFASEWGSYGYDAVAQAVGAAQGHAPDHS